MVTLPPAAVRVPEIVLVLPKTTLPKASEVGLAFRDVIGVTPVPVREITVGLLVALLATEI